MILLNRNPIRGERIQTAQPEDTGRTGRWGQSRMGAGIRRLRRWNAFHPRHGRRAETPGRLACLRNIAV
jgi:hypothetical protein